MVGLLHVVRGAFVACLRIFKKNVLLRSFTHTTKTYITEGQLWGWEVIMTFLLIAVVYAVACAQSNWGNIGPLAIGFTLFASAFIGEQHVIRTP